MTSLPNNSSTFQWDTDTPIPPMSFKLRELLLNREERMQSTILPPVNVQNANMRNSHINPSHEPVRHHNEEPRRMFSLSRFLTNTTTRAHRPDRNEDPHYEAPRMFSPSHHHHNLNNTTTPAHQQERNEELHHENPRLFSLTRARTLHPRPRNGRTFAREDSARRNGGRGENERMVVHRRLSKSLPALYGGRDRVSIH